MIGRVRGRVLTAVVCLIMAAQIAHAQTPRPRRPIPKMEEERVTDPPVYVGRLESSPQKISSFNSFTSYQVNVDANGFNIVGDAANEPSLTVNPIDRSRMSIGWRQFNTVFSNFRQGGFAYSSNDGENWTFPGVLSSDFRSDPVLQADAAGNFFYLSLLPNFVDDLWRSPNGGQSYGSVGPAFGGDKEWFTIDNTNSPGRGFLYQFWNPPDNGLAPPQFTRSTDSGASWMDPTVVPRPVGAGTLDVDSAGNLYIGGVRFADGSFWCLRSSNAKNALVTPSFDQVTPVELGGSFDGFNLINPEGLTGQVYLAVDRSGTSTNGNVYFLASVVPDSGGGAADVMFARSTNGGASFGPPRRVNDDPANPHKWHWFGTLAVAPNGRIDVVWMDTRNAANNTDSQLFYSSSFDGGVSWSANVAVSQTFDPLVGYPRQQKMGDYISMVSDSAGANVAYTATFNGEQDIYFVRVTPAPQPLRIRSITRSAGSARLVFASNFGKSYRCDYSDSPAGPWLQLQTNIAGTGGEVAVNDSTAGVLLTRRFYQVTLLL